MGKRRPFIDKRNSTTYSLVYRNAEEHEAEEGAPERVLVPREEVGLPVAEPPSDPRQLYLHFFGDDNGGGNGAPLSAERRLELLEYGFPDDGYDYLKHCRVLGGGRAALEGLRDAAGDRPAAAGASRALPAASGASSNDGTPLGQSVFIPAPRREAPTADVKLVDARRLAPPPRMAADAADVAEAPVPAAPAAAPPRHLGGLLASELAELEAAMAAAETLEAVPEEEEEELGAFLDTFVASAAVVDDDANADAAAAGSGAGAAPSPARGVHRGLQDASDAGEEEEEEEEGEDSGDELEEVTSGSEGGLGSEDARGEGQPGGGVGAETYAALNDRFEALLEEYSDGEVGDLEDDERTAGTSQVTSFAADLRLPRRPPDANALAAAGLAPGAVPLVPGAGRVGTLEASDPEVVAAIRARLAAEEAAAASGRPAPMLGEGEPLEAVWLPVREERWDCESVLSLRSNYSHAPSRICEPRRVPEPARLPEGGAPAPGTIKLSARTGLPSGYAAAARPAAALSAAVAAADAVAGADDIDGGSDSGSEDGGASLATSLWSQRPKGETPEERRVRKAAVKEAQRAARETKKQLKVMYKQAAGVQQKQQAGATKGTILYIA